MTTGITQATDTQRPTSAPTPRILTLPATVQSVGLLLARILLGVILIAHGWQKLFTNGFGASTAMFAQMGLPLPGASAAAAIAIEIIGGALIILGLLTPIAGLFVVGDMLGAFIFVHASAGLFAASGGWELVAALAIGAAVLSLSGPGRYSIDSLVATRKN